jgi:GT2 family glycosyltransferase
MSDSLTIVTVNYHNQPLIKKQLKLLADFAKQTIVIDNSGESNTGFAHACNQGLTQAIKNKSKWTLFLNPDVEISPKQIKQLIKFAQDKKLDAVSSLPENKKYRQPIPSLYSLLNQFTPFKKFKLPNFARQHTLTGGILLAKTETLKKLNGWDERFFLWFEDSDLTKQLIDHNYKIGWAPIKIKHHGGGSIKKLEQQQQRDLFFHTLKVYAHKYFSKTEQKIINLISKKYIQRKLLPIINPTVVSIVIPNLKKPLLLSFFEANKSFFTSGQSSRTPQNRQIEWIIVSSALKNQDLWELRKKYPQIRFISISQNKGFAQTVNIGLKAATGKWIGTINDDVILPPNFLDDLLNPIEKNSKFKNKVGSINPVIKNPNSQNPKNLKLLKVESAGIKILPKGKAIPQTQISNKKLTETDATNGACVLYSREALNKTGLFDERFGSYLEDIDLSLRLARKGFLNLVNTKVSVTHLKHQTSSTTKNINKTWLDLKNWWLIIFKNWTLQTWFKNFPQILLERGRNFSGLLKSLTWSQRLTLLTTLVLPLIYIWTRLYKLETSLIFFNDIGRDLITLFDWQETLKPPLLGPQTSALPYNQSAIYFYLLMPFYLLSGHSPFSTIWTALIFYVGLFLWGAWQLKNKPLLLRSLLISSFLITIHPQFILQTRFVWNPTFVGPLLLISIYTLILALRKFSWKKIWVLISALTLATSLNYSVGPVLIATLIYISWVFRNQFKWLKIWFITAITAIFWNLPTLFFELRHKFLLTKMLFFQEGITQVHITLPAKINDTFVAALTNITQPWTWIILGLILGSSLLSLYLNKKSNSNLGFQALKVTLILWILTTVITFMAPISIQTHYIFGILTLGILLISLLKWQFSLFIVFTLSLFWLQPNLWQTYFKSARHPVAKIQECAQKICHQINYPVFVSNQASWHPYHNAMEWRYMFKEHGCKVKQLDTEIEQAQLMLVVVDDDQYQHGKTAYNELTQFGKSQQIEAIKCQPNLEVVILKKE